MIDKSISHGVRNMGVIDDTHAKLVQSCFKLLFNYVILFSHWAQIADGYQLKLGRNKQRKHKVVLIKQSGQWKTSPPTALTLHQAIKGTQVSAII